MVALFRIREILCYTVVVVFLMAEAAECASVSEANSGEDADASPGEDFAMTTPLSVDSAETERRSSEGVVLNVGYDQEWGKLKRSMMGLFGLSSKRPQYHNKLASELNFAIPEGKFLPVRGRRTLAFQFPKSPHRSSYNFRYQKPFYGRRLFRPMERNF